MLKEKARAKINLTLDILGKRSDGYHEVSMVMQQISLADELYLTKKKSGISLVIEGSDLPADEHNLAWQAAKVFFSDCGQLGGVNIHLIKHIPLAAGLAGGSADAAAVLRGLFRLYGMEMDLDKLCHLGAQLGSDVPFCIAGGTALSTGRGEILQRLYDVPSIFLVLAKPPIAVSTAWAYRHYDEVAEKIIHPENEAMCRCIRSGDIAGIAGLLCNVLESVTIKKYEEIKKYKEIMLAEGARAALMSGSGPTVFGLADSDEAAEKIASVMRSLPGAEVFVASTVGRGV